MIKSLYCYQCIKECISEFHTHRKLKNLEVGASHVKLCSVKYADDTQMTDASSIYFAMQSRQGLFK